MMKHNDDSPWQSGDPWHPPVALLLFSFVFPFFRGLLQPCRVLVVGLQRRRLGWLPAKLPGWLPGWLVGGGSNGGDPGQRRGGGSGTSCMSFNVIFNVLFLFGVVGRCHFLAFHPFDEFLNVDAPVVVFVDRVEQIFHLRVGQHGRTHFRIASQGSFEFRVFQNPAVVDVVMHK